MFSRDCLSYYRPLICMRSWILRFSSSSSSSSSSLISSILSRADRLPSDRWRRSVDQRRMRSTIFALSSGGGKCGVQVFRVSGPNVREVLRSVGRFSDASPPPPPRKAILRRFFHPRTGEEIDRGLLLWFPGPFSFTGEDCCELHVHGGLAVSSAIVDALGSVPGLQYASPGEFTRRSFQNGKLDLTEVEGLADLINAETEAERRQALRQMDGVLSRLYSAWREKLLQSVAHLEAFIDFSEEENLEDDIIESVLNNVIQVQSEIQRHLLDNRRGERLRRGVHMVIIGEPNVGKSSLLNALCQRPAAMVSPVAGTTRDIIEMTLNISGYPVIVSDTAGLRHTKDELELEGVRRAIKRSLEADLLILVIDISDPLVQTLLLTGHLTADQFVTDHLKRHGILTAQSEDDAEMTEVVLVLNKDDLLPDLQRLDLLRAIQSRFHRVKCCLASCCTANGLDEFLNILTVVLGNLCNNLSTENPVLTNDRQRLHLVSCLKSLTGYIEKHSSDCVLGAEDLRRAIHQIGKITGRVTTDDLLDVIFKDFCIGK